MSVPIEKEHSMQILERTGSILVVWSETEREGGNMHLLHTYIMVYMCVWGGWGVGVGVYICIEDISDPNDPAYCSQ